VIGLGGSRRLCSAEPRPVTPTGSGHESPSWRMVAERPFSRSTARTVHRIEQGSAGVGERPRWRSADCRGREFRRPQGPAPLGELGRGSGPGGGKRSPWALRSRELLPHQPRYYCVPTRRPEVRLAFRAFTRWLTEQGARTTTSGLSPAWTCRTARVRISSNVL
jgi:hypothetical protein